MTAAPLTLGHDATTGHLVGVGHTHPPAPQGADGVLLTGAAAAGKTAALAQLAREAIRRGSLVVSIAPRDLAFDDEDVIDLSDTDALPGVLDPLRLGSGAICHQVGLHALLALAQPARGREEAIATAVRAVSQDHGDLADVIDYLDRDPSPAGRPAAAALALAAAYAPARLVFPARVRGRCGGRGPATDPEPVRRLRRYTLNRPATTIRVPLDATLDYTRPAAEHTLTERASAGTVILLAAYALAIASRTARHKLLLLDEPASQIIATIRGRAALDQIIRLGRLCNTTVALATQHSAPATGLGELFPTRLAFRQPAELAARVLDLDHDNGWAARLSHYPPGTALLRDHDAPIREIQVGTPTPPEEVI